MPISLYRLAIITSFLLMSGSFMAQHFNLPLDRYSKLFLLRSDSVHHGSFQGLPVNWTSLDTIKGFEPEDRYARISRKIFDDHLISIEEEDFELYADLLLHFEVGFEQKLDNAYQDKTRMSRNMRGFIIRGNIGDKVSFETSFREQQSFVPYYLFNYTEDSGVMPGSGRIKEFNGTGRDHSMAEGYVAYAPADWVNLQFGSQKNFIGSGYRSLLLSDNAYTYPQLKGSFTLLDGKLKYHAIHAWLQTLERLPLGDTPESLFIRKNGSFKYLEFNPMPQVSLGLFEGVMWNRFDPESGTRPLNPLAFSPLIGTSALALGLSDPENNVVLGLDISARPIKQLIVYGQYILDDQSSDGYQIGVRTVDLAVQGLSLRLEYNSVSPFTYSNDIMRQNYAHFGQALAHPMGAAFDELNAGLMYFINRWFVDLNYVGSDQLLDLKGDEDNCTSGGDIFNDTACEERSDLESRLDQVDLRVGKLFNPKSNFNVYLGWLFRERNGVGHEQEQSMFTFGLEMSLSSRYEDF